MPQQLELYNAHTGALRKALYARGIETPRNLDVQGNIATYTTGAELVLHALNLSTGKDRVLVNRHGGVEFARLDRAGLVYAGQGSGTNYRKGTLVFRAVRSGSRRSSLEALQSRRRKQTGRFSRWRALDWASVPE